MVIQLWSVMETGERNCGPWRVRKQRWTEASEASEVTFDTDLKGITAHQQAENEQKGISDRGKRSSKVTGAPSHKLSTEQGVCREGVWQGWDSLAWGPWVHFMIITNLFFLQLWFSHFLKYQWFAMAYWVGVDTCFLCLSSVYFFFFLFWLMALLFSLWNLSAWR